MKKSHIRKNFIAVLAIVLLFVSCRDEKFAIKPPLAGIDIPFEEFELSVAKTHKLITKKGSLINIPANSFVDSTGKAISGNVKVRFREMSDAIDIFLTGIPLAMNPQTTTEVLETAGMFEIRAYQDNKTLNLARDKAINVKLASNIPGEDYGYYELNDTTGNWNYVSAAGFEKNEEKIRLTDSIEVAKASAPLHIDEKNFVFNYAALLEFYLNDMSRKALEKINNKVIKGKIEKYNIPWKDIDNRMIVYWNNNRYIANELLWERIDGEDFPEWTKGMEMEKWNSKKEKYIKFGSMIKKDKDVYEYNIWHGKRKHKVVIKAIMPIKYIMKKKPETWQNNFDNYMATIKKEENRIALMADAFRNIKVKTLGICNYDRLLDSDPNSLKILASFEADIKNASDFELDEVFYFSNSMRSYIRFHKFNWDKFVLAPNDSVAKIVTVLPGNKVAYYNLKNIDRDMIEKLRHTENPEHLFSLKTSNIEVNSADQFRKILLGAAGM